MHRMQALLAVAVVALGATWVALAQDSRPARPRMLFGTLVKVDGTKLVVKQMARGDQEAKEVTVETNDKTKFTVDAEAGKLADLKPEMSVVITPDTGTAETVRATSKGVTGVIVKVDGKNVVVRTGRGDTAKEVTVATDEKTKVFVDDKPAKLEDLKADMRVTAIPETGTATKIIASAPRARPGGGGGGGM